MSCHLYQLYPPFDYQKQLKTKLNKVFILWLDLSCCVGVGDTFSNVGTLSLHLSRFYELTVCNVKLFFNKLNYNKVPNLQIEFRKVPS